MARCGCGGACGCSLSSGDNTVVTGSGTSGNPWVVDAHTDCAEARACFAAGNGLSYDSATGTFSAKVSPAAGNTLTVGSGGLFVPTPTGAVTPGCGLTGNGSAASPLRVNTAAWPFACAPEANGSVVACDANGLLKGEPGYHSYYFQLRETRDYSPALVVPAAVQQVADPNPFTLTVTNPDPCRAMRVLWKQEIRALITLPPNSAATFGFNTEDMWSGGNGGTTTVTRSTVYTGKIIQQTGNLPPGSATVMSMNFELGRGSGGATCTQVHMSSRVWLMPI